MDSAHVRPAALEEIPALWRCDALSQSRPERKSLIEHAVQRQECLVAEVNGQIAGFAVLHHQFFERSFIALIVVARDVRRRGVALELLRAAERFSRSSRLFSSTNASNLPGNELLLKAGFSRSGVVDNLDPGDPEYIYFKEVRGHEG